MACSSTVPPPRTSPRWLTAALGLALLGALLAPASVARAAPLPLHPPPGLIHRWTAFNQVPGLPSLEDAASIGAAFDLVVIKATTPAPTVARMRAVNPDVRVLVYHNGAFAQAHEGTRFPEAWYARDAAGAKMTTPHFGNYLMDVSSLGWRGEVVRQCRAALVATTADGCYTDMLMTAPLFPGYVTSKPINPATGLVWTFGDFQRAVEQIADLLRAQASPVLAANGVGRGVRWFATGSASSRTITDHAAAAHCEICWRDRVVAYDQWPSISSWRSDVDMIVAAEAAGKSLMVQTKLWPRSATEPLPSAALVRQWRWFTLASFLLGTSGRSWYLFNADRTLAGMARPDPATDVRIGTPTGPYARQDAAFTRSFTSGFVAVNPGGTGTPVTLPAGTWRRPGGATETGTVHLGPHTGVVWEKVT